MSTAKFIITTATDGTQHTTTVEALSRWEAIGRVMSRKRWDAAGDTTFISAVKVTEDEDDR